MSDATHADDAQLDGLPLDRFEALVRVEDGARLPYRLHSPPIQPGQRYPLILLLHGAGERGDDNRQQLVHGATDLTDPQRQARWPCFVVAPQCPADQQWVEVPWSAASHLMPAEPSRPLAMTLRLLDELERQLPIDGRRIYITGLSMGGFGVWDAVQRHPDRFAAAVPVCGGGDETLAAKVARVPAWLFHGDQDTAVRPARSRNMVVALRQAGGEPKYTEYAGVGHNSWLATYRDQQLYEWLFRQRRE